MSMLGLPRKPDPRPSLLALDTGQAIDNLKFQYSWNTPLMQLNNQCNECKFSLSLAFLASVSLAQNSWSWRLTSAILNIKEYQGRLTDAFIVSTHLNTQLMYICIVNRWPLTQVGPLPRPSSKSFLLEHELLDVPKKLTRRMLLEPRRTG